MNPSKYALGASERAARRLEIQDQQFAAISEALLDELNIRSDDRVLELGVGAGSFSRRVLARLGPGGSLVGVDFSPGLLEQAAGRLAGVSPARLQFVSADIRATGPLAREADVVLGRTVLHHLPMPELFVGELFGELKPGARLGFIEPEFRVPLARLMVGEKAGRGEWAPLRRWAEGISRYYQSLGLAPTIGATLARTFELAGYREARSHFWECPTDAAALENMQLYYDEIRDKYVSGRIMSSEAIDEDQRLILDLQERLAKGLSLPAVWGMYGVSCVK